MIMCLCHCGQFLSLGYHFWFGPTINHHHIIYSFEYEKQRRNLPDARTNNSLRLCEQQIEQKISGYLVIFELNAE